MRLRWLVLPALFLGSCCAINRLPGRGQAIKTVAYEVSVAENPTVRLTGHRSLEIRQGIRSAGIWSHTETELEQSLTGFGGEGFSAVMLEQAAGQLGARLGWALDESGAGTDAVMQILVENICFCAPDVLAEVEVNISFRAMLTATSDGELLWRDCLDWTFKGDYPSLQQLGRSEAALREELVSSLAARLLGRLAEHLASHAQEGADRKSRRTGVRKREEPCPKQE